MSGLCLIDNKLFFLLFVLLWMVLCAIDEVVFVVLFGNVKLQEDLFKGWPLSRLELSGLTNEVLIDDRRILWHCWTKAFMHHFVHDLIWGSYIWIWAALGVQLPSYNTYTRDQHMCQRENSRVPNAYTSDFSENLPSLMDSGLM